MTQFWRNLTARLRAEGYYPRSGLARFTLWVAGLYLISELLALAMPVSSKWAGIFAGWASFFEFVLIVSAVFLFVRWVRRKLLWRLRNRLIVTYVFIGVIPVVLILTMFAISGYLLGNQLTTLLVHRDLLAEVQNLDTLTSTVTEEIADQLDKKSTRPLQLSTLASGGPTSHFPEWTVAAWLNGKRIEIENSNSPRAELADASRTLRGVMSYNRGFIIRTLQERKSRAGTLQVIMVVPITEELLFRAVSDLGQVTLYSFEPAENKPGSQGAVTFSDRNADGNKNFKPVPAVTAGSEPVAEYKVDPQLHFGSVFPASEWETGSSLPAFVQVNTRPSILNHRVFTDLGTVGSAVLIALTAVAIAFAIIELIALVIGVRLTRTITGSIAQLYRATQYVNRGELAHRIEVKASDQLASLET